LKLAFDHLRGRIEGVLATVEADPSVTEQRKRKTKEQRLLRLRDNALRLQLIVVELTNEDDAYLIFETLNTRGKDLGVADLVKNFLTRLLRPTNKGVDIAKDKWNGIRDLFDASAADIDTNAFIYHAWLSRYPYIGKEKIFKELKLRISKPFAMNFLDDLVEDANLYRNVLEPASHDWPRQELKIASSLEALNIFRVVQPVPMTLSILRGYRHRNLTLTQARSILRDMENFHVQFTAVTAQRTGGGTARMYAAAAEALTLARDKNAKAQVLKDFKGKMRERIPSYQEFEANFGEIEFISDNTKQKSLVQYLVRRFDEHLRQGAPANYEIMGIEHIAPENPAPGVTSPTSIGKLGNLLLLPDELNARLGNTDFKSKLAAYKKAGVPLDPILEHAQRWGDEEIARRTIYLPI
jgi:hypothetical protein